MSTEHMDNFDPLLRFQNEFDSDDEDRHATMTFGQFYTINEMNNDQKNVDRSFHCTFDFFTPRNDTIKLPIHPILSEEQSHLHFDNQHNLNNNFVSKEESPQGAPIQSNQPSLNVSGNLEEEIKEIEKSFVCIRSKSETQKIVKPIMKRTSDQSIKNDRKVQFTFEEFEEKQPANPKKKRKKLNFTCNDEEIVEKIEEIEFSINCVICKKIECAKLKANCSQTNSENFEFVSSTLFRNVFKTLEISKAFCRDCKVNHEVNWVYYCTTCLIEYPAIINIHNIIVNI